MEEDNVRKVEINVHDGGQVNIANDDGKINANVDNKFISIQDKAKDCDIKIKLYQKWLKYINIILAVVVVLIVIYRDIFGRVVYEEGVLTPIYYYELMQDYDAREFAEEFTEEIWDYGCMLNVYLSNKRNAPVTVSETSIVIDDIIKTEESKVYIIGDYSQSDDMLTLYAINNGIGQFNYGEVSITVNCFSEEGGLSKYLTEEQITFLLGRKGIVEINNLVGGEIRKIASTAFF